VSKKSLDTQCFTRERPCQVTFAPPYVKQFLNRPGQALRQQVVEAHRSSGKSTHEDGNVASRIIKSWYLCYYSGHEISGPSNKSAHNFQPLICASSKPPRGIFTNKWVFVLDKLIETCILHIFRKFVGYSVAAVVDLCYMPAALHVRTYVCTSLVTRAATCVVLFCPSSAYHGRTSSEQVSCLTLL